MPRPRCWSGPEQPSRGGRTALPPCPSSWAHWSPPTLPSWPAECPPARSSTRRSRSPDGTGTARHTRVTRPAVASGTCAARPLLAAAPIRRPQRGLDHVARRRNVRGAFRAAGELGGARIVVVDDVFTTGATLSACATALRKGGAGSVAAVTLARVVRI